MKKKIVIINTIITVIALILMFALGIIVNKSDYRDMTEDSLKKLTAVYADKYDGSADYAKKLADDLRVTVINAEGKVICDTEGIDISSTENHLFREEVVAAAKGEPKAVVRHSDTLGLDMMYYALKTEYNGETYYVRTAMPVKSVDSYLSKSIPLTLGIMFFAAFLSVIAVIFASNELLKPLSTIKDAIKDIEIGNYKQISPTTDDAEVNKVLSDVNDVAERLEKSMSEAKREREKSDYILNNVSDAIVVLDKNLTVVAANRSAHNVFRVKNGVGMEVNVLTSDEKFISAVHECSKNKTDSIFRIKLSEEWFHVAVKHTENDVIIAVLTDVTAERNGENMRLEFFANASHELKTPLTTIKGFNDMISLKTNDETLKGYSQKIDKETERMLSLIDDMLNLSKLENLSAPREYSDVNIKDIAEEVAENLKPLAEKKNVSVTVSGELTLRGEREHFYELVKNLAENAVRYNKNGGYAKIELSSEDGKTITVSDNGIGIDDEHQGRIFERFYRVDKSRSRVTGGTGLGLSIVKHVCELYGAEISLKSRLGFGTTVTVRF